MLMANFAHRNSGFFRKFISLFWTGFYILVSFAMFLVSVPIFTRGVGQPTPDFISKNLKLIPEQLNENVHNLHLVSSYGLFRRMTGVGGRPEVIIEVANQRNGPWKEINFRYKPGNLSEPPQFVLPHQPRLDWQMWFAALGDYQHNPWFISLLYRILQNKPEVMALMNPTQKFKKAPKFIRSKLYKYHFTKDSSSNDWWTRDSQTEYSPVMTIDDPPALKDYLTKIGILSPLKNQPTNMILVQLLQFLRKQTNQVPHHVLVWSISWIILPIIFMK